MSEKTKPTHEMPGGQEEDTKDDGVVNDSLGTVDSADSTGLDEEKETGDAKEGEHRRRGKTEAGLLQRNKTEIPRTELRSAALCRL